MKHLYMAGLLIVLAAPASAQSDLVPDGRWVVEWDTAGGRPVSADLTISNGNGEWRQRVRGRTNDPCVKVAAPARVETSGGETYLHIEPSKVIQGCTDSRLTISKGIEAPVAAWRDGRAVKFVRP